VGALTAAVTSTPDGDPSRLTALSRVCGRLRDPAVTAALAARLGTPDPTARSQVVADLNRCGWLAAPGPQADALTAQLARERSVVVETLQLATDLDAGPRGAAVDLLAEALALEQVRQLHRILGLLALRDPSGAVRDARRALVRHGAAPLTTRQRDYLLEVLEAVGERRSVPLARALTEPVAAAERLALLGPAGPPGPRRDRAAVGSGLPRWRLPAPSRPGPLPAGRSC
jgi:hypothetical protein